jgi:hypothetical protein
MLINKPCQQILLLIVAFQPRIAAIVRSYRPKTASRALNELQKQFGKPAPVDSW